MTNAKDGSKDPQAGKRPYAAPRLTEYGSVAALTRTGTGTVLEGSSPNKKMP
jgi:hypothetical protein